MIRDTLTELAAAFALAGFVAAIAVWVLAVS